MKFANSPLLSQLLPAWRARFVAALILLIARSGGGAQGATQPAAPRSTQSL